MSEVISYNEMQALFQEMRNLMQENELRLKQEMEEWKQQMEEWKQQMEEWKREMEKWEKARMEEEGARKKKEAEDQSKREEEEAVRKREQAERDAKREKEGAETDLNMQGFYWRSEDLGNRLGWFITMMVRPAAMKLLQIQELDICKSQERTQFEVGEEKIEVDLLVTNWREIVLVECAGRLTRRDVEDHVKRMEKFKRLASEYRDLKVCGAVAGMVVDADAAEEAAAAGLFLLVENGENVEVAAPPGFVAREF